MLLTLTGLIPSVSPGALAIANPPASTVDGPEALLASKYGMVFS
jgi:hypothetical protein